MELTPKQRELYDLMSEISEDCYCAVWMNGNEFVIWRALQGGDRTYGQGEIEQAMLEQCRQLATEIGGWIVWPDNEGERFMPMDQWLAKYAANTEQS